MRTAREESDILSAYKGSFRAAAELCGTIHKTVRRVFECTLRGQDRHRTRAIARFGWPTCVRRVVGLIEALQEESMPALCEGAGGSRER